MKPKLAYTGSCRYTERSIRLLQNRFDIIEIEVPDDAIAEISNSEILIASIDHLYNPNLFSACKELRYVVSNTTGVNHIHIPSQSSTKLIFLEDRSLINTITTTAELALSLMLAALRNIPLNHARVATGTWDRYECPGSTWMSKKVGIIGLGRLGKLVAGYCQALGMVVAYYDPHVEDHTLTRYNSLSALVGDMDIVSLHAVLNEETEGLIDSAVLENFKKGSIFINTARGELVDEIALVNALETGRIAVAAIDVLTDEQNVDLFELNPILNYSRENENTIITPHIGGACIESREFTENIVIGELLKKYE